MLYLRHSGLYRQQRYSQHAGNYAFAGIIIWSNPEVIGLS